jgi:glycosyltransferase involved in cell wall biosynthesis
LENGMKVLALSHSAVVSAYREKFRRLAKRKGWDLHLVLPHAWPEGGKDVAAPRPGREGRLQLHVLRGRLRGRVGFATLAGLQALALDLRPQMVYAEEEPYSLGAYQALRAARAAGAAFAFYTWENMDRRYKVPLNWVRRQVLAGSVAGVAGNGEGAGLLRSWDFQEPLLTQPQYGVDTKHFKPLRQAQGRLFTVGYFGRLVPEKGVDLLLKAAGIAKVAVRIGGQGPEERALRSQCDALGVDANFEGFVPFERRADFYAGIDVLALPSRTQKTWKEQFGRVLAEAMACGVPCLGSDSGAIPEVIGKGGLIAKEDDEQAWASALKRLAKDKALRTRLGKAGRQRALKHFDEQALVDDLGRFLERAVHGS